MTGVEANFDGLVGPTHNYSGLAWGNTAAIGSTGHDANPRAAALQGLAKMKALADWGIVQGVLPPQERPNIEALRRLGFEGRDAEILARAARYPEMLAACSSAASMWAANAATVSPSADTADHRVHFTPANLAANFHRSIESRSTSRALRAIFGSNQHFIHHRALPSASQLFDEGAANHMRLSPAHDAPGVEVFVFGRHGYREGPKPHKFPARQTYEASQTIARKHGLNPVRVVFAQQNPAAIDAGVFHNDVIAVADRSLLLCHEMAFVDQKATLESIRQVCEPDALKIIEVPSSEVSIGDAIKSYMFNSQLVSLKDGTRCLIVPSECEENESVWRYLRRLRDESDWLSRIVFFDVRQSMRNGGGPACLRLRVVLKESELKAINRAALITDESYSRLIRWVERYYRDRLNAEDLADPELLAECRTALDELTGILKLGPIYDFQR